MNFQSLEFDTDLFGFKVAKILPSKLSLKQLQDVLLELKKQQMRLVYWASDSTSLESQQAAQKYQGTLCSEQITYLLDLKTLPFTPTISSNVKKYNNSITDIEQDLQDLAIQAGTYSRFNYDPKFPHELFLKLYYVWIKNSVNRSIAAEVLVFNNEDKNQIIGMITLGIKNKRGDIGLLAVNQKFRNQKVGTKLIQAAQAYFIKSNLPYLQVVTQKSNTPACYLYEKCGFKIEKIENYYHFWL